MHAEGVAGPGWSRPRSSSSRPAGSLRTSSSRTSRATSRIRTSPFTGRAGRRPSPRQARHNFTWAFYGYTKGRTRYLPASKRLRPPYRQVWIRPGSVLLEFPPIMARQVALRAQGQRLALRDLASGRPHPLAPRYGSLAASSPAYGDGTVYVVLLKRFSGIGRRARGRACRPRTGTPAGRAGFPAAPSPRRCCTTGGSTSAPRTARVFALRARDGAVRWTLQGRRRGQGRHRARRRQALLRRLRRPRLRAAALATASRCGPSGTSGRRLRAALGQLLLDARGRLRPRLPRQHRRRASTRSRPRTARSPGATAPAPTSTPRPPSPRCRARRRRSTSAPTTATSTR